MEGVTAEPYYRSDLAWVHDRGFGFHADRCAPGILTLLRPVLDRGGTVLELGCGSGLLTRHLVDAGHRVLATDASPAMLDLARARVPEAEIARLALPDDPLPAADAIVSVGHCLSYLPDAGSIERSLAAAARALRPGGVLALDLCDLSYGERPVDVPFVAVEDDWVIVTRYGAPAPDRWDRFITTFVRRPDSTWRRDDEHHANVLVDTAAVPDLLAPFGVEVEVGSSFGTETLPAGLMAIVGHMRG